MRSDHALHSALWHGIPTDNNAGSSSTFPSASSLLLSGTAAGEQTFNADGILERAQLTEDYAYAPFAGAASAAATAATGDGLRARVSTKLQLKKTAAGQLDGSAARVSGKTIVFVDPAERQMKKAPEGALKAALAATTDEFTDATDGSYGGVRPQAAARFAELVQLLRHVTKEELLLFVKQIGTATVHANKVQARAVFLDALFRTATSESVEALASLLATKSALDRKERRMAIVSLHLVKEVQKDALTAIGVSVECEQVVGGSVKGSK